ARFGVADRGRGARVVAVIEERQRGRRRLQQQTQGAHQGRDPGRLADHTTLLPRMVAVLATLLPATSYKRCRNSSVPAPKPPVPRLMSTNAQGEAPVSITRSASSKF